MMVSRSLYSSLVSWENCWAMWPLKSKKRKSFSYELYFLATSFCSLWPNSTRAFQTRCNTTWQNPTQVDITRQKLTHFDTNWLNLTQTDTPWHNSTQSCWFHSSHLQDKPSILKVCYWLVFEALLINTWKIYCYQTFPPQTWKECENWKTCYRTKMLSLLQLSSISNSVGGLS